MKAEQNLLVTRIGPSTPAGELMRHYWHPVALLDEFDARFDARMGERPVKAVRLLGQDLVLFRDGEGKYGLLDRDCPHRGADLAFGRREHDGLRCPFHGWKFNTEGQCIETPAESKGSTLCSRVKQRSYPVREKGGVLFAYMGPEGSAPPEFPAFDCFTAPSSHVFAFKGLWNCNWLQAFEVGIDPAHASFLHRFFEDESLDVSYGKQFRGASSGDMDGEKWPMTRVLREFDCPDISFDSTEFGLRITALRQLNERSTHVRVTNAVFPNIFVLPLSETISITQFHVPVDDTHTYWYSFFTSFADPLNKEQMRNQRLQLMQLPDYVPRVGRHNDWGFNAQEQIDKTYTGMGDDINVHDQWAVESQGPIADRTREHLGTTDKVIISYRRTLLKAIDTVQSGGLPPVVELGHAVGAITGPDTIDGIAPNGEASEFWRQAALVRRANASWAPAAQPSGLSE